MYLLGAGGHAKVIIDILTAQGIDILGLFDNDENIKELLGYPVFTTDEIISPIIISIGDNKKRKTIAERITAEFITAIHPSAVVSKYSHLGEGTVVMQNAVVQTSCQIGKHCIINTSASIDHDCVIGNYVHISPNCAVCGNVTIGEGTWVGAGSAIIPGVTIGKWCVIGAGSIVTKNIPDYSLASGNRCRIIKSLM
ncbi:MAG TPA: acetyltransferase [Salinivirgaceae bacterium]|nr:acetyltransferase [Salinivirgaceae bacterium]